MSKETMTKQAISKAEEELNELTQVQVSKKLRQRLQLFKASYMFKSYDETITFLLDDFAKKGERSR